MSSGKGPPKACMRKEKYAVERMKKSVDVPNSRKTPITRDKTTLLLLVSSTIDILFSTVYKGMAEGVVKSYGVYSFLSRYLKLS